MNSNLETLRIFAQETLFERAEKASCTTDIEEIKRVADMLGVSHINDEVDDIWQERAKEIIATNKEIDQVTDPHL
jgi:enhancing lycopene biosynthesis protein 2